MINWLRQRLLNFLHPDLVGSSGNAIKPSKLSTVSESGDVDIEGLSFVVMPAQGGTIVQIRSYDRKTDRSNRSTHIIPEGEDIAYRVGQITSMELLRHH